MPNHPQGEETFPNNQSKPPLAKCYDSMTEAKHSLSKIPHKNNLKMLQSTAAPRENLSPVEAEACQPPWSCVSTQLWPRLIPNGPRPLT